MALYEWKSHLRDEIAPLTMFWLYIYVLNYIVDNFLRQVSQAWGRSQEPTDGE